MSSATRTYETPAAGDPQLLAAGEHRSLEQWASARTQLDGDLPQRQLPTDYPRGAVQTFRAAMQPLVMTKSLSDAVKALSQQEGVTLFATVLAAFEALLFRYTGQAELDLGAVARHEYSETQRPTGSFMYAVVRSTNLSGSTGFRELIRRVQGAGPGSLPPPDMPFEPARKELQSTGHSLMPRVLFSLESKMSESDAGRTVTEAAANYDLYVEVKDGPEGITGRFNYNADLFGASTIARLVEHWRTLLEGAVADPGRQLSALPLLSEAEQHQQLVEWNDTHVDYEVACLHELIEAQVERTPDAVAVVFEDQQLSYRDLNTRANQLGHYLQKVGVGPGVLVGICVERSLEMVVGLLGILKAGGTYVPLDPGYPRERLAHMVEDSGLKVLLAQEQLRTKLCEFPADLICVDSLSKALSQETIENCLSGIKPNNLAYVIYTSGSTGKPKGVQISHRSLVNFLTSMQTKPGMTVKDTLLAVTTISFDIAGLELYLPLTVGARVVLVSRETAADGQHLREKLATSGATWMQATPATWRLLLESGWEGREKLKILCGGEALPRDLAKELAVRASSLWNLYGPTETTIWSTVHEISSTEGPVLIGRPIANTQIYILDKYLKPVPVGVPGELYIGGDGVAQGYLNRPELTAEKFIFNPFRMDTRTARLYRTGDLARYHADGNIECLGRLDHQVKVRGFRIELEEIESVLNRHPGVQQTVVVAREDIPGDKRLVAYLVPARQPAPTSSELRSFLRRQLPEYMLPSAFVILETIPLTPNGKVDRRALPPPEQSDLSKPEEFEAPRNPVESQLVKIWETVLRTKPIGIRDNFFELGGHSVLVAKLLRRVEQVFGKKVQLATLFHAPTIEQFAASLRNQISLPRSMAVVPIQPLGSKPPFFLIGARHILRGALPHRLGFDQPFLGLYLELSELAELSVPYTIEDIASRFVQALQEQQPEGPYYFGGYCFNGVIAYEMARQLSAQGQQVALLIFFAAYNPAYREELPKETRFNLLRQRLRFHLSMLRRLKTRDATLYVLERLGVALERVHIKIVHMSYGLRLRMNRGRLRDSIQILNVAARSYRPQPYPGRAVLFRTTKQPLGLYSDLKLGWGALVKDLDVHVLPTASSARREEADNSSMFLEPEVATLASKMADCLRNARNLEQKSTGLAAVGNGDRDRCFH
jgi:amino acid adenylation domain-containing protein